MSACADNIWALQSWCKKRFEGNEASMDTFFKEVRIQTFQMLRDGLQKLRGLRILQTGARVAERPIGGHGLHIVTGSPPSFVLDSIRFRHCLQCEAASEQSWQFCRQYVPAGLGKASVSTYDSHPDRNATLCNRMSTLVGLNSAPYPGPPICKGKDVSSSPIQHTHQWVLLHQAKGFGGPISQRQQPHPG